MDALSPLPNLRAMRISPSAAYALALIVGAAIMQWVFATTVFKAANAPTFALLFSAFIVSECVVRRDARAQARIFAARLRELEETNRLLKLTETTARVGHWRLELAKNEIYWSDGCFAIHGFEPGTPGIPPALSEAIEFFHEEDRAIVDNAVETSRASGEPFTFQARLVRADGEIRHTLSTALVEFDDQGEASALFGVFCDRTEEEEMQRELRDARNTADALANARQSFLAKMSHEIRTPMNGILGFAELLSASPLTREQRRHVELITDSGNALQTILNDILDLSKVEGGHMELRPANTDLAMLVRQVARLSIPAAQEKNIALSYDMSRDVPRYVKIDALRMRQILGNILANALRFTDQGAVHLKVDSTSETLSFSVSDTGIGLSPDKLEAIFDPFTQDADRSQSRRGGSGLGLAISSQLAELMGGQIDVISAVNEGTTFTVTVPLVLAPAPVQPPSTDMEAIAEPFKGRHDRILLAEDFDINQELICDQGRRLGLTFEVVEDGEKALAAVIEARNANQPFAIVLMDLQMPRMNGLKAAEAIREAGFSADDLPIIALTANAFADDVEACLAAGMQEHIAKPLEIARLSEVMRKWLRGYSAPVRLAGPR